MTAAPSLDGRLFDRPLDTECVADVARRMVIEYGAELPAGTVTTVVREAGNDLAGQVPAPALAEMLERLVRYRLDRLVAAGAQS